MTVVMSQGLAFGYGIAIGAGVMFLLDPRGGAARRALIHDKSLRVAHEIEDAADVGVRDLEHRLEGAAARLSGKGTRARRRGPIVTPALKLVGGAISALYGVSCLLRGAPIGVLLGGAGVVLAARSMRGPAKQRALLGHVGHGGKTAAPLGASFAGQVAPSPAMP